MASSGDLAAWLASAPPEDLVRRTAHWMDEAVKDRDRSYRDDPGSTGVDVVDALVAAAVELVALRRGDDSPKWIQQSERFLDHFWYPGSPSLFAWALAHSPGPFRLRGLLVEADSLVSV